MRMLTDNSDILRRANYARAANCAETTEWYHIILTSRDFHALINVSTAQEPNVGKWRLLYIFFVEGKWQGGTTDPAPPNFESPGIVATEQFELCWEGSDLIFNMEHEEISCRLVLRPMTQPGFSNSVNVGQGPISWVTMPRLSVHGHFRVNEKPISLKSAVAYHDHNWGKFSWGSDAAWDWCLAQGTNKNQDLTAIYSRMLDPTGQMARSSALMIWHGQSHLRTFRGPELTVFERGVNRKFPDIRLPSMTKHYHLGTATQMPAEIVVRADSFNDKFEVAFESGPIAQIGIPSNQAPALCMMNESLGTAQMKGAISHVTYDSKGCALIETIRNLK
jgi:hypothetical protein